MYLKSIEVHGFKSFAHKMVFQFNKGITGIVGPNGSGKSNVADAVRWVLGEQSAKQLRGSKMEDVIFSGTETRKPLGFAYVAITLDNSDHKLSIDYDQVTVARRVYRSGESEYLINGSTCRLREVQELFFDTGVGKEGYSIIGQGQIDKILSGKPEERRELFDEAAGIVKYKKRKVLAEKNLESEKQNLYRVNDILAELEKQVGPLERQSEKAREYLKLKEQLKVYDVNMYLLEFGRFKEELARLESNLDIARDDLEKTQEAYVSTKEEYERLEIEIDKYNKEIEEKRSLFNDSQLEKQRLEGQINVLNEQVNAGSQSKEHYNNRIKDILDLKEKYSQELLAYEEELCSLIGKIDVLGKEQQAAQEQLDQMSQSVDRIRNDIEMRNGDIIGYLNEAANVKTKAQRYDTMLEQINIRKSELTQRLLLLNSEEIQSQEAANQCEKDLKETIKKMAALKQAHEDCQNRGRDIQDRINRFRDELTAVQQKYHGLKSKYATLKNIADRYDGYGISIKKVMEQKNSHKGIHGVVADIIRVKKQYETAIEIALGGSIQNVVTDTEETAKQLIGYLKKNRYGRATFLPLTSIGGRSLADAEKLLKEDGVIGLANTLVEAESQYTALIQHLLGRILVVDHIDNALKLARKYKYSLRIVTVDGESLSPGGSMSGGAYKNSGNLLGRHREIDELEKRLLEIEETIKKITMDLDGSHDEKRSNKQRIEQISRQLQELTLKENTVRLNLSQARTEQVSHKDAKEDLERENKELAGQIAEITQNKDSLNEQLSRYEALQSKAEEDIANLTGLLEKETLGEKDYTEKTSGIRIEYSNLIQRKEFIEQNISRVKNERAYLDEEIKEINKNIGENENEIAGRKAAVEGLVVQIQEIEKHLLQLTDFISASLSQKENVTKEHKTFFAKREELSQQMSLLDKELFRLNSQKEKLEELKADQGTYMWEEYELTYVSALYLKDEEVYFLGAPAIKKRIQELKTSIRNLGDVNVNAIEEYKTVSERYQLLKVQRDDLVDAEQKLLEIIASLDKSMREQFSRQFATIQVQFDKVFKELFGGGKGTLELVEDADILYAGIRIIAQPPGKKLQNMMQLSGGEKALTAIALLFAIQSLKPSPFCLLDEIEAALDDANVKRFAKYLDNLTMDTQFIVITHRRGTMNAADVLYGITMQEKGVSTLVSVDLIENQLTK